MSMILDALTRAEHERQIENQPDLKFVSPVRGKKSKPNHTWVWVTSALLINAIVIAYFFRPTSAPDEIQPQTLSVTEPVIEINESPVIEPVQEDSFDLVSQKHINEPVSDTTELASRPLAMELTETQAAMERPLIYESKSTSDKKVKTNVSSTTNKKKGNVSFSQSELSVGGNNAGVQTKPKLLIDQGNTDSPASTSSTSAPKLKDLPESTRLSLSQYEVNVHVYDDISERSFVLINMDKYKEGDRISNNGPIVDAITRDGVIVDYGQGRAVLPPK